MCVSGAWMRLLRRATAKANELVLEITEQSADGRRFDRRLPIEKQKGASRVDLVRAANCGAVEGSWSSTPCAVREIRRNEDTQEFDSLCLTTGIGLARWVRIPVGPLKTRGQLGIPFAPLHAKSAARAPFVPCCSRSLEARTNRHPNRSGRWRITNPKRDNDYEAISKKDECEPADRFSEIVSKNRCHRWCGNHGSRPQCGRAK